MAKPVKLSPKVVMALLVQMGIESVQAHFLAITEGMRADVQNQLQDLRTQVGTLQRTVNLLMEQGKLTVIVEAEGKLEPDPNEHPHA